ncbi:MAG TPA: hypothetical protein VN650_07335 [Gemmatimonadaceae bacterium]|nr:hypothetical protein [Gemmatimonadaceae bacterium]
MTMIYAGAHVGHWRVREDGRSPSGAAGSEPSEQGRFPVGRLFATPGVVALLEEIRDAGRPYSVQGAACNESPMSLVLPFLRRHVAGDWGDVGAEDWKANDEALVTGERLLSAYVVRLGERLWIITEADRSLTTVLLPDEY